VDHTGKHPTLTITNPDKLEELVGLASLNGQVAALLLKIDLTELELILKIQAHTKIANVLSHVSDMVFGLFCNQCSLRLSGVGREYACN